MSDIMLACGCAANATSEGKPCCAIHLCSDQIETPNLAGRMAKCVCGKTAPSSTKLPFFEYRGPDSRSANDICKNCRYSIVAHDPIEMAKNVPSNRKTVVEDGRCKHGFEPHGAFEYDSFYCLCMGTN